MQEIFVCCSIRTTTRTWTTGYENDNSTTGRDASAGYEIKSTFKNSMSMSIKKTASKTSSHSCWCKIDFDSFPSRVWGFCGVEGFGRSMALMMMMWYVYTQALSVRFSAANWASERWEEFFRQWNGEAREDENDMSCERGRGWAQREEERKKSLKSDRTYLWTWCNLFQSHPLTLRVPPSSGGRQRIIMSMEWRLSN